MRLRSTRSYALIAVLALLALPLCVWGGSALLSAAPKPAPNPTPQAQSRLPAPPSTSTQASVAVRPTSPPSNVAPATTFTLAPAVVAAPTLEEASPTPVAAAEAPTAAPTPEQVAVATPPPPTVEMKVDRAGGPVSAPNKHPGPRWVTLQAGHWHSDRLPDELRHLADNTGTFAAGLSEVDVNVAVCRLAAAMLQARGYSVDILDATVPEGYTTDLFLAVHADGSTVTSVRGFKAVAPWVSVPESDQFVALLYEEYGKATGLPSDAMTSVAMADYYAFNPVTYRHAIAPGVPAALIELGFVTNPTDRLVLATGQESMAWGIANAVDRYFRSGAAGPTPSPYPSFTPTNTPTPTDTATSTPTETLTLTPTETATTVVFEPQSLGSPETQASPQEPTATAAATIRPKLTVPTATRTPIPTSTPLTGTVTTDGRWLPPMAPNGRNLPPPGSDRAPVLLSEDVDEPFMGPDGRERQQVWQQFYVPELGRSVWRKGPLRFVRP